jgi:hypothetical protein
MSALQANSGRGSRSASIVDYGVDCGHSQRGAASSIVVFAKLPNFTSPFGQPTRPKLVKFGEIRLPLDQMAKVDNVKIVKV